jgi:plasmid stabilization system protein ParE
VNYTVRLSQAARLDIEELLEYLVPRAGEAVAFAYIGRLKAFLQGFETFPERGMSRDDVSPGLRIVGYHRKATIAFLLKDRTVMILRIYHGGRNVDLASFAEGS